MISSFLNMAGLKTGCFLWCPHIWNNIKFNGGWISEEWRSQLPKTENCIIILKTGILILVFFKTKIMQGIVKCLVVFSPGKCFSNDNRKAFRVFLFAKVKTSAFNRRKATNSLECWIDTGTITALLWPSLQF